MTHQIFPIAEAQEELPHIADDFEHGLEEVIVTKDDKPVMVILPLKGFKQLLETIESLQETIAILQDEELMAAFREGVKAMQEGETVAWEDAKLGLLDVE